MMDSSFLAKGMVPLIDIQVQDHTDPRWLQLVFWRCREEFKRQDSKKLLGCFFFNQLLDSW